MIDVATLRLDVKSDSAKVGVDRLDDLAGASGRAERSVGSFRRETAAANSVVGGLARVAAGAAAGFFSIQTAIGAGQRYLQFNAALAETSTLIEGTAGQMQFLSDKARQFSREMGGSSTTQMEAFYQAISAGAQSVEEAANTIEQANKLAVGGATDVATAVGIMSGVINSYGREAISAAEVTDALFVGVRDGVTTVDQLAGSLGMVIPLAKSMGLSFDETVAAVAALTKNNLSTSVAVTSLNAALTAVSGPTSEARDLAASLGLEFNTAALQAKGFGEFMADVTAKTGGSVDAMRTLFGSVEGMKAALLFAGEAGGQFNQIMGDMAQKTGETETAFQKMLGSDAKRWETAINKLSDGFITLGGALVAVALPVLESFNVAMSLVVDNADVLGIALATLAASRVPALIGALSSAVVWLGSIEGMFIAGAVAARGLALAMNLIPFVAVVSVATLATRAILGQRDAHEQLNSTIQQGAAARERLNEVTALYAGTLSEQVRQSALREAEAVIAGAQATMTRTQAILDEINARQSANSATGAFTVTEEESILRSQLRAAREEAEKTQRVIDALNKGMQGPILPEGSLPSDNSVAPMQKLADAAAGLSSVDLSNFNSGMQALTLEAQTMADAQRALAEAGAASALRETLEEASKLTGVLKLSANETEQLSILLSSVAASGTFEDQARALSAVVDYIMLATDNLQSTDSQGQELVGTLLEALSTASQFAGIDMTSGINAAVGSAQSLAAWLNISLASATALAAMGNDPAEERLMGMPLTVTPEAQAAITRQQWLNSRPSPGRAGGGGGGGISEEQQKLNALMAEGEKLTESLRTEVEKYNDDLANLKTLQDAGAISTDTFNRAVAQLNQEFREAQFSEFYDGVKQLSGALADAIVHSENLGEAFANTVRSMAAELIQSGLESLMIAAFGPLFGIGGGLGKMPGVSGGFKSFEGGGETGSGPRSGGVDGRGGFFAILHPDESVNDHRQGSRGAGAQSNNVNIHISLAGANGNRELEEIAARSVMQGLQAYDSALPSRVKSVISDPRAL